MKPIGTGLIALAITLVVLGIATYLAYARPFTGSRPAPYPQFNFVMVTDAGWNGPGLAEDPIICCCFWHDPKIETSTIDIRDLRNGEATILPVGSRPDNPDLDTVALDDLLASHIEPTVIEAAYPRLTLARGIEGDVLVEAKLAPDGTVSAATIIVRGPNAQFDKAAINAVMAARFAAPVRDGQQLRPTTRRFLIRFRLPTNA